MKKYVIFDFNGTLLDDVDFCLVLLNEFLEYQNKPLVTLERYKEIFGFPISDYYVRAGIDLKRDKFSDLALIYNEKYMKRSIECKLYSEVIDTLKLLKDKNVKLIVLSATEQNNLEKQLKYYEIYDYFDNVLGLNNYEGASKIDRGIEFMSINNISKNDIILIGDSIHDFEVASSLGCDSLLYSKGHMSRRRLENTGSVVIDSLLEIENYL